MYIYIYIYIYTQETGSNQVPFTLYLRYPNSDICTITDIEFSIYVYRKLYY